MKQILCPKCFDSCSAEEYAYVCTSPGCPKASAPVFAQDAPTVSGKPVCPDCKKELSARICRSCGYEFGEADSAFGTDTLPFSIVGAEGSGKSNYLSVLIDLIKSEVGKAYNCSLYPLGGDITMEQYEKQYYTPLFVHGKCVASTQQETIQPLVYSLVFSGRQAAGKTCNITFYDACGANFDSVKVMGDHNRSIYNSRAILFLIDPSQLPELHNQLKMQGRPVTGPDASSLLSRTIHLIRNGRGMKNMNQKIDIPIAICLTKVDTIRHLLDPGSFLRYPSRHLREGKLDRIDCDSLNLEVQSLIESWAGKELLNQIQSQFETYSFFGFSALGASPGEQNQIHRISPHRVADPFLWALWKNNIISSNV